MVNLGKERDKQLINAIRSRPILYNKNFVDYRNKHKTDRAWTQLAAEISVDEEDCKLRWRYIRDSYARKLKSFTDEPLTWPNTELSFLDAHISSRNSWPSRKRRWSADNDSSVSSSCNLLTDVKKPPNRAPSKMEEETAFECAYIENDVITKTKTKPPPKHYRKEVIIAPIAVAAETSNTNKLISTALSLVGILQRQEDQQSRNADFLKVLDSYLMRLSDDEQDGIKLDILQMVYAKRLKSRDEFSK